MIESDKYARFTPGNIANEIMACPGFWDECRETEKEIIQKAAATPDAPPPGWMPLVQRYERSHYSSTGYWFGRIPNDLDRRSKECQAKLDALRAMSDDEIIEDYKKRSRVVTGAIRIPPLYVKEWDALSADEKSETVRTVSTLEPGEKIKVPWHGGQAIFFHYKNEPGISIYDVTD